MKEERKLAREDKELDLKDLFVEVLIHWKGIIIAALIGGLVLGGYSYYSSYKENRIMTEKKAAAEAAKQSQEESVEKYDTVSLDELEKTLSETSKNNVKSVLTYSEQLARYEDYASRSVFMLVDEKAIPRGTFSFCVVSETDDPSSISGIYRDMLSSSDLLEYVKEQCKLGTEVSEQISVERSQSTISDKDDTVNVYVYGLNEEQCTDIINAICEYAGNKCAELQASLGEHSLVVLDSSVSKVYEKKRIDDKYALQNTILSLKKTIAAAKDAFTEEEKEYFNILQDKIKMEIANEEEAEPETEEEIIIPPVEVSKKKILIGIAGGLVLYVLVICVIYIFSRKIKDSDDFESLVRVPQLGKVYRYRYSKGLAKKIYSIKFGGRKVAVPAEAEAIISDNVAAVAEKESVKKLGVLAVEGADSLIEALTTSASEKSIDVERISDVLYSREQMNKLDCIDAVLLIAKPMVSKYDDIYDVVNVLDNRGIKILGGVMD